LRCDAHGDPFADTSPTKDARKTDMSGSSIA
jgi:hypothetical protein